jgi:hypothetical protein
MRKITNGRGALAGLVLLSVAGGHAHAGCDPNAILRRNVAQYNENIAVFLSYIRNLQKSVSPGENSAIGLSYDGVGLSLADAASLANNLLRNRNYQIDEEQSTAILRATLTPDGRKAYFACVNSRDPVDVILPDAAVSDQSFHFQLAWDPDYPAKKSAVAVHVANGTIGGDATRTLTMQPNDTVDFEVKRDGDGSKPLTISAYIFGKVSDPISLPGLPQFVVKLKPRATSAEDIKRSGTGDAAAYVKHDLCVYPDGDAILLPSTMKFASAALTGDPNRARAGLYDKQNTSLLACGYIENSAAGAEDFNEIGGQFLVFETDLQPLPPPAAGGAPAREDFTKRPSRYQDVGAVLKDAAGAD